MWDSVTGGIRWFYAIDSKKMYFRVENFNDLKRSLGIEDEESDQDSKVDETGPLARLRNASGMDNSRTRQEWMRSGLFAEEDQEPEPAPVINIESVSEDITKEVHPQALGLQSHLASVNASALMKQPVEITPLFHIIKSTATELDKTVWQLELELGSPSVFHSAFLDDKQKSGKSKGISFAADLTGVDTFRQYIHFLLEKRKLTGSCGQTSEWIHRITGGFQTETKGQQTPLPVDQFLEVLNRFKSHHFYMRVLSGGHSFIIESTGKEMAIYQSWHGSAPMAIMLEGTLKTYAPLKLISLLQKVLTPKASITNTEPERQEASKEVFYDQTHSNPTPLVWFSLNLNPLTPSTIKENIKQSLNQYKSQWEHALSGKDMTELQDDGDTIPTSAPKSIQETLEERGIDSSVHDGLRTLHADQTELSENPKALEEQEKPSAPQLEQEYVFKGFQGLDINRMFIISAKDVDREIDSSASEDEIGRQITTGIVRGLLKPGTYTHMKSGEQFKMTKTGSQMSTQYKFTKL